jgi:hypothetical protein
MTKSTHLILQTKALTVTSGQERRMLTRILFDHTFQNTTTIQIINGCDLSFHLAPVRQSTIKIVSQMNPATVRC